MGVRKTPLQVNEIGKSYNGHMTNVSMNNKKEIAIGNSNLKNDSLHQIRKKSELA